MAVIAVVSAKGSPGATTTTVALARDWQQVTSRRGIALDLDPVGGDFSAGVLGGAVPAGVGVLSLATDRGSEPADAVSGASIEVDGGTARLMPGVPDSARCGAIPLAWDVVARALPDLTTRGVDLFIDGGRLDGTPATPSWLPDADTVLLVVRPSLPWVSAARRLAKSWPASHNLRLVVVDSPSPYGIPEVVRALELPLAGVVAFDPRAAQVHSEGSALTRSYRRSAFARSIAQLARSLEETLSGDGQPQREAVAASRGGAA